MLDSRILGQHDLERLYHVVIKRLRRIVHEHRHLSIERQAIFGGLVDAVDAVLGNGIEVVALATKPTNLGQRPRNVRKRELLRSWVKEIEVAATPQADRVFHTTKVFRV